MPEKQRRTNVRDSSSPTPEYLIDLVKRFEK